MQLSRRTVQALSLGLVTVCFAGCGGGVGGGTSTPGGSTTTYYRDVVGIGFADSPRRVPVGQWPSWFAADALVTGCSTGQSFYLDRCWYDVELNLDTDTVTFRTGAQTEVLQVGGPLPAQLGAMKERAHGRAGNFDEGWQDWALIENTGPGYIEVFYNGALSFPGSREIWGELPVFNAGVRSRNGPWAVHGALDTVNGLLSGVLVKTAVAFGIQALDPTGVQCRIAHSWTPKGRIIVAGTRLELPTTLEAVSAVVGRPITRGGLVAEQNADWVTVKEKPPMATLSVRSDDVLKVRRTACGETDQALLTNHLVTSVAWRSPLK
jgi:hypothetical protein